MKKIVGIFAAAAVLATSVFAADVSATAKVKSTLFNFNSDTGAMSAFGTLENNQTASYATLFNLSVSSDNAGGGVVYYEAADDAGKKFVKPDSFKVWFKPTDAIKLSFRENALELFGDKYNGYYAHNVAKQEAGYGLQYAADAITLDINLQDGFVSKDNKDADVALKQVGAKLSYNADFGSLAFIAAAGNTFKAFDIGFGFSGNFDSVGVVFNAGAKIDTKADTKVIGINPSAGGSVDAISWAIDVPVTLNIGGDTVLGTNAKASYALDACKLTAYFEDSDFLKGDFDAKIGCAIEGSVGAASWKVDPSFKVDTKVFNVALETGISF